MSVPPLLMIAEGRKPRLRRAPIERPPELRLHMSVAALLRKRARPDWQWTHFRGGERLDAHTAAKFKQMGVRKGWSDFIFLSPDGRFHRLELKRRSGTLSEEQQDYQRWAAASGLPHSVAESFDDALAVLRHWGALLEPQRRISFRFI